MDPWLRGELRGRTGLLRSSHVCLSSLPDDIGGVQARALPPATVLLLCTYYYGGISIRVTLACRFAMLYLLLWGAGVPCPALLTPMACDRTASAAFSHARCAVLAWRCSLLTRASSSNKSMHTNQAKTEKNNGLLHGYLLYKVK